MSNVVSKISNAVSEGDRIGCQDGKCWADCGSFGSWCWTSATPKSDKKVDCSDKDDATKTCPILLRDKKGRDLNCVGRCAPI